MKTDNELIAEFMKYSKEVQRTDLWCRDFHENFSALMPVLTKIVQLDITKHYSLTGTDSGYVCMIMGDHTVPAGWQLIITRQQSNSQIEAVYKAVVEFIKWYNVHTEAEAEGTEGQDRENYTDDQDRESYNVQ